MENCITCKYYKALNPTQGECRRYAPKPTFGDAMDYRALWLEVLPLPLYDCCGEYECKPTDSE